MTRSDFMHRSIAYPIPKEGPETMSHQIKVFSVILCLVAITSFSAWPMWTWLSVKSANAALQAKTRAAVEKHPELRPALNIAMQDGVLTWPEAKEILEAAGEKVDPE
jgi:hypothetical protein